MITLYPENDLIMKLRIKTKQTLRSSYLDPTIDDHLVVMTLPNILIIIKKL